MNRSCSNMTLILRFKTFYFKVRIENSIIESRNNLCQYQGLYSPIHNLIHANLLVSMKN